MSCLAFISFLTAFANQLTNCTFFKDPGSGVGVRLKVGINIEKIEGMGCGEGLCPPHLGEGGLQPCPQKKNQFCAKNYAILSRFWYFFPILQQKVWGNPPSQS